MILQRVYIAIFLALLVTSQADTEAVASASQLAQKPTPAEHAILFVLEGVDHDSLKADPMPVLSRLAAEGAATWSASSVSSAGRLPAMASLLTGLSPDKHGITWNTFEFSRGYPRPPTVFDYLDLSGGRDSAIFFMDESLYQLAKPEPYTDYQLCGSLREECTPERLVAYINQYFRKASSGHGYGHAVLALPHLLVVHLPESQRAGEAYGWGSKEYRRALRSVDAAMGAVLKLFQQYNLLARATIFVTSLQGRPSTADFSPATVPWIAFGKGIKPAHRIQHSVSLVDTGATVLRALGLSTYTEWDSHPVEEIFLNQFIAAAPNSSLPEILP